MKLRQRFHNSLRDPSNHFAVAFAIAMLGGLLRTEPRIHLWIMHQLGLPDELSTLLVRGSAAFLMLLGATLLFVASVRMQRNGEKGKLQLWLERQRRNHRYDHDKTPARHR